ncbi:MAG TPA: NUDIX domain-containing protein [Patescibacteria group bacterium]
MSLKKPFRAVAIFVDQDRILLMERIKSDNHYFVFPGGRIEVGETPEEAVKREAHEETSLRILQAELIFELNNGSDHEYYFLVKEFTGELALGGEERDNMTANNQYILRWVPLNNMASLSNLFPLEGKEQLIELLSKTNKL